MGESRPDAFTVVRDGGNEVQRSVSDLSPSVEHVLSLILSDTREATVGGSFDRERAFRWRVPGERVHVLVSDSINDDHPTRMVNRAARFDYSEDRNHSYVWEVPQPGHGPNFWIPLRINPEQEQLWAALLDGDVSPGQLQLIQNRTSWTLHVAVEYSVEEPGYDSDSDDVTHIGLDIGESSLIMGCALKDGSPTRPLVCDGSRAKHLRRRCTPRSHGYKSEMPPSGG